MFRVPDGSLLVTPTIAAHLRALLADGRREWRREGVQPPEQVVQFLDELDALAANQERLRPPEPSPATTRSSWLPTSEVAELLDIGQRAVLSLGRRQRWATEKRGNTRYWLEADVVAELENRSVA